MTIVQPADATVRHERARPDASASAAAEREALVALIGAHQTMVWRYLRLLGADAHQADDLMQDTFVVLAERLENGDAVRSPAPFLRGIARNLLIAARRRTNSKGGLVEWSEAVDKFVAGQPRALDDGRIEALRRCVARLGGRVREAIEWHHIEGLSCRDTARRLGLGMDGIKSLLGRARAALRECIEQQLPGDRR